ncbi:MAG: TonB-dependent receptor plug domain-containing protein [Longimicrobiales bacterium]
MGSLNSLTFRLTDSEGVVRAVTRPDSLGAFSFSIGLTRTSVMKLDFESDAYAPRTIELNARAGDTTHVEVTLKGKVLELAQIVGEARRGVLSDRMKGFEERRRMGAGHFVTRAQIDDRPGSTRLSDFIRTVPGVALRRPSRTAGGYAAWTLSNLNSIASRYSCPMYVFIDGVAVHGAQGWDIDMIPASQLQGIEVYRGVSEVPNVFGIQQSKCGVIAIWTRRD